jgi:sugar phosphate isomerase/epimerase
MKNRRDFLRQSALLAAGTLLTPTLLKAEDFSGKRKKNIGIQLYSLRDMVGKQGIQPVLEAVSAIGYVNLETAGYSDGKIYGLDPADFSKRASDLGMKFTSAHLGQSYSRERDQQVMDWWKKATDAHAKAGAKFMIQASMPVNSRSKLDDLKLYCEYFNKVGALAKKSGLYFGFHNHTSEFQKIGENVILDYMIQNTDPNSMMFELDVYWCQEGGANPVDYLKKYSDRFLLTHIKDEKEIGASGKMNFEPIFNQMKAGKVCNWFVEIEQYTKGDPVGSAKESFEYLNKASYVK